MTIFIDLCRKFQQTTISCGYYAAKYVFSVIALNICLYSYIYSVRIAFAAVWRSLTFAADFLKTVPHGQHALRLLDVCQNPHKIRAFRHIKNHQKSRPGGGGLPPIVRAA